MLWQVFCQCKVVQVVWYYIQFVVLCFGRIMGEGVYLVEYCNGVIRCYVYKGYIIGFLGIVE